MARLPVAPWADDPALQPLVELILRERGQIGELYPMLLHSPPIAEGMIHFGNGVRKQASLDPLVRELVICLVGALNHAEYEVFRHREIATSVGATQEQLDELTDWEGSSAYDDRLRASFAYARAMTVEVTVPDDVFEAVRSCFVDQEVLELTVTVAYYNMISRILVALEVHPPAPFGA